MPWRPGVDRGRSSAETPRAIFGGSSWARSEIGDGRACAAVSIDPGPPGDGPLPASLCIIRRSLAARTLPNTRPAHSPEELRSARQNRCRLRGWAPTRNDAQLCVARQIGSVAAAKTSSFDFQPSIFRLEACLSSPLVFRRGCGSDLEIRLRCGTLPSGVSAALFSILLLTAIETEILRGRSAGERRYGAGCSRGRHGQR
jgi:hypothetical protein